MVTKNQIKRILHLQQKKYRKQYGQFFVEGQKVIRELLDSDFILEELYVTEDIFKDIKSRVLISEADLKKMSALTNPNNSLAVFRFAEAQEIDQQNLIVALDKIRDPGNLGTIIRLCDWFGISELVCSEDCVDAHNPKVLQATMGSITRVNITYLNLEDFISTAKVPVFGTFMEESSIYKTNLPQRGIIVMGNEANGISTEIEKLITDKITIPRFGNDTESLNVATAAAIVMSEFRRNS
ncbi:MAG TPA: RNA methyltransferase [Flavobacterium sp.]|nr:RNA methyltransferase [Flavobacterium sp.]